jgi:hypothetical protein
MSAQTQPLPQPAAQPAPSPMLFFETINGYQRTAALKAAIELELFTAIGEGASTPETIALSCQASVRGIRIMSDYLAVLGFITKSGGHYVLTRDTAMFLDRRSPAYVGGAIGFLTDERLQEKFDDVAACVRKGGTVAEDGGTMSVGNPIWLEFARSMGRLQANPAEQVAQLLHVENAPRLKVLDIAAGHGMYGSRSLAITRMPKSLPWTGRASWAWPANTPRPPALPQAGAPCQAAPSTWSSAPAMTWRSSPASFTTSTQRPIKHCCAK